MLKKIIVIVIISSILTGYSYNADTDITSSPIYITDPNLEACIDDELKLESEPVTINQISELTSLSCPSSSIKSIEGLEYATSLRYLNLNDNEISDLSPLKGLSTLISLELRSNQIGDLSPLQELSAIQTLDLSSNQITDLTALQNMQEIKVLRLYDNQIKNIDVVSSMPNISQLLLGNNQIKDIDALSELKKLKILKLDNNQVSELQPLFALDEIQTLSVGNNRLTSLDGIENNHNLKTLMVENNQIKDISALDSISTLRTLNISDNQLDEISAILNSTGLESLAIDNNNIGSIEGINQLQNLTELRAANNQLVDISELAEMLMLTSVDLSYNQITTVPTFKSSHHLKWLNISNNQISDLSGLQPLQNQVKVEASSQTIILDSRVINDLEQVEYLISDISGETTALSTSNLQPGNNNVKLSWKDAPKTVNCYFSGTVEQNLDYQPEKKIVAVSKLEIDEGQVYTDSQLVAKFLVQSSTDQLISVDQSQVNYQVPGKYQITFYDQENNSVTSTLVIKDVIPVIKTKSESVYVPQGQSKSDYLDVYEPIATELLQGDLNSLIEIDDSAVDLFTAGRYPIKFSVQDQEKNISSKTVHLTVFELNQQFEVEDGAKISIQRSSVYNAGLPGYEYTIYDENGNVVDVITTDENGHAESEVLSKGIYTVELTNSPDSALNNTNSSSGSSETTKTNTVNNNQSSSSNNQFSTTDDSFMTSNQQVINVDSETTLVAATENQGNNFSIVFNTVYKNGTVAQDIRFEVVNIDNLESFEVISDSNGLLTIENLEVGNYIIKASPDSAITIDNNIEFIVSEDGVVNAPNSIIIIEQQQSLRKMLMLFVPVGLLIGVLFVIVLKKIKV